MSVLLGEGDGSFQAAVDYGTGDAPTSVLLGDLNRDGTPDLVATNAGSKSFSVLLGQGDGSFASAMTSTATTRPIWRWRGTTPAR